MEISEVHLIFLVVFQGLFCIISCSTINDRAAAVAKAIFNGYDTGLRPECEIKQKTTVNIGVSLRQILEVDEPSQQVKTNVWMRLKWNDCRLTWNATEYGKDDLYVPAKRIWLPDVTMFDSTNGELLPGLLDYRVRIMNNGDIIYNWPTVLESFCKMNVKYFPKDTQTCDFIFCSWMYHGNELDWTMRNIQGDLENYQGNAGWKVESYTADRHEVYYRCCEDPYVDITFYLIIKRTSLNHIVTLVYPCVLISWLTLLGFLLPVESGEKISLQVTVILSLDVFLLVISESLPPSSDSIPLLEAYFACSLALVTTSCVITVAVIHVHFKVTTNVPEWIRKYIILKLGRVLLVDVTECETEKVPGSAYQLEQPKLSFLEQSSAVSTKEDHLLNTKLLMSLNDAVNVLRKLETHFLHRTVERKRSIQWRTLATIIDRIFFLAGVIFLITTTAAFIQA